MRNSASPTNYINSKYPIFHEIRTLFSKKDQVKIIAVAVLQIGLSILDLISVAFVGLLTALTINGIQSKKPTGTVSNILSSLGIGELDFQHQAALLGLAAGSLLIFRTILSLIFNKKLLVFLSIRAAKLSSELISKLLRQPLLFIQEKSIQETIYLVTVGVVAITTGVIAIGVSILADIALLVVMLVGLTLVNPIVALVSALAFGIVGLVLYQLLKHRAAALALNDAGWSIQSNQKLAEVLTSYREAIVGNRRDYYTSIISDYRYKMARAQANSMFIPTVSKYVVEMSLVVGSLALAAVQFLLFDAVHAISILAVFLAAGARVAPAILRLQQGAIQIKSNLALAKQTLKLWTRMNESNQTNRELGYQESSTSDGFVPSIKLANVFFRYPNANEYTIKGISLEIKPGEMVAIAGSSGAGKSTLVDLILGVLEPTQGIAYISDTKPSVAISKFSGLISYVPQDVLIVDGNVRLNVALGFPIDRIDDELIWSALRAAQLEQFVRNLPDGLDHVIGERGTNLSGGQRQRLGLARGLFTQPQILVLDEATSALDGKTESSITEMLLSLRGSITLIVIAHRLSTIQEAERVIFLKNGVIETEGTFAEVEARIPEFGMQNL